eukprot:9410107-Pyramimonas_sp.AAC.1
MTPADCAGRVAHGARAPPFGGGRAMGFPERGRNGPGARGPRRCAAPTLPRRGPQQLLQT